MRLPASLICWNVGPRPAWRIVRSLRRLRKHERPDAIALFEARRALPAIRRKFGKRWHVFVTDDVVLLIRKGLEVPDVQPAGHQVEWWGPKEGIEHEGREHMIVTWDERLRWVLMHGTPGGPKGGVGPFLVRPGQAFGLNRAAWNADERAIRTAVRDFPGGVLLAGDLNAETHELAERFALLGVRNVPTHAHVDHAAQRRLKVTATRLDNYGSDHPAIRLDPTLKETP